MVRLNVLFKKGSLQFDQHQTQKLIGSRFAKVKMFLFSYSSVVVIWSLWTACWIKQDIWRCLESSYYEIFIIKKTMNWKLLVNNCKHQPIVTSEMKYPHWMWIELKRKENWDGCRARHITAHYLSAASVSCCPVKVKMLPKNILKSKVIQQCTGQISLDLVLCFPIVSQPLKILNAHFIEVWTI